MGELSRANPSRGGDAKPRVFELPASKIARLPAWTVSNDTEVRHEGEVHTLCGVPDAHRIGGACTRRWDALVLAMRDTKARLFRLLIVLSALSSSAIVLEAGRRWCS
jgi:hypothetical protein